MTRAGRNIAWIEKHCVVPEGKDVGKPVVLRSFQRDLLVAIYDNPNGTRRALVSFGRKNGKTALAAFLCLLHTVGPEARPNSQLFSAAQSREQASILFNLMAKVIRLSPALQPFLTIRMTSKEIHCAQLGTTYRALSAEASTAFGLSPVFIVHDELGQVRGPRSPLFEALETATAGHADPLSIVISTQSPNPEDLLSVLLDDAAEGNDPRVVSTVYTTPEDVDPFTEESVRLANPAFGDFQNPVEVMAMAEDARRMPSRESEFRNLVLNQRVEIVSPFVSRAVWDACNGAPDEDWGDTPVYAGLDLSSTSDLTAFVMIALIRGDWHVKPVFWLPGEGIREKSRTDRVPYDMWAEQGYLNLVPHRSIEYSYVADALWAMYQTYNLECVNFDRYNYKHLRPWLLASGFTEEQVSNKEGSLFREFGQGFVSMSPALRDLESDLLDRRILHGGHPVLTMNASRAIVTRDPAENRKLDKAKAKGRIDGMVALAMARAAAIRVEPEASSPWDDPAYSMAGGV